MKDNYPDTEPVLFKEQKTEDHQFYDRTQLKEAIKGLQQLVKDQSETIATLRALLSKSGRSTDVSFSFDRKIDKDVALKEYVRKPEGV